MNIPQAPQGQPPQIPTDPKTGNVVGTDIKPENPVIGAVQTLIMYTAAQTEKGAPNAIQLQSALSGLVDAFQSAPQQAPGQAPQPGPGAPPPGPGAPPPGPQGPAQKQGLMNPQQAAQQSPQMAAPRQRRGLGPTKNIPII